MIAPLCITMNDFFQKTAALRTADRLGSLTTLYDCYKKLYPSAEPLDEFVFWGSVLLNDFAEVDKYLVNPSHLFSNVADFRRLQDSFDYLEPRQREALEHFLGQFRDSGEYKERFRRIWDILLPLYRDFNAALASEGLASEGAVYRTLAEKLDTVPVADVLAEAFPQCGKFVFAGLNALNECEKKVLRKMRDARLADFCWDWSSDEIRDPANRSSFFLSQNVAEFPQAFIPDPDGLTRPVVNVVSCPSAVGQTKLLPEILGGLAISSPQAGLTAPPIASDGPLPLHPWADRASGEDIASPADNFLPNEFAKERSSSETAATLGTLRGGTMSEANGGVERSETVEEEDPSGANEANGAYYYGIGINTAIVLPEEGLLLNVLNSIPEEVRDVNVTMGYPVHGSEFNALLDDIAALQQNTREKNGITCFYHKYVWGIFSNSIIRTILDDHGKRTVSAIRREARYFIPQDAFGGSGILNLIFRPADNPADYMRELLLGLAPLLKEKEGMQMELDFAMFAYKAVIRLKGLDLKVQPRTWWRLFDQLVCRSSVPFKGEPLRGLQIMGPLETRALDFENLIILSCNEGTFPRRAVSASFIPAELRKGFGLPTYEYQDSVWAYYFYRLIQRAKNVWLLFDTRTELGRSGEESRYIRQLQMLYGFDVRRHVVKSPIQEAAGSGPIEKTDEDIAVMHGPEFSLSVSSLQNYLNCPAKFYYSKIKGLKAADEVSEALDAGMMGSVLHETMQALYDGRKTISLQYIDSLLKDEAGIRAIVAQKIMEQLNCDEVEGRNLIFEELITRYALQILSTDKALLKDAKKEEFELLGIELKKQTVIDGFRFTGYIDRLDSFDGETVRIVDYKTGKVTDKDIDVNDSNAAEVVDALFGPDNTRRPKIALQLYLYGEYLQGDARIKGRQLQNCIYQTAGIFREKPKSVPRSGEFCRLAKERLSETLAEITDSNVPWRRTEDAKTCEWCDFKTVCGR